MADPKSDETNGKVAHGSSYDDSKGALENLHDAIGSYLGFGKRQAVSAGKGIDQTVDEAVESAKGANPDY